MYGEGEKVMQIAIVRTSIFDRQVLPVLKAQAVIAKCSLGDHIRSILYKAHGYTPKASGHNGAQVMENMMNKTSNGKTLFVAVDDSFYHKFNIPGNMKTVNKILYEAAGCGQLCR